MLLKHFVVGPLGTNCYLIGCEETVEALVIDAGFKEDEVGIILKELKRTELQLKYIVNTHGHMDHISGNEVLKQATGTLILIHAEDLPMLTDPRRNLSAMLGLSSTSPLADRLVNDGDTIRAGSLEFIAIHTPGHTKGSISLYCEKEGMVFTGDTLFAGSISRTDLPRSSFKDIIPSLKCKLMKLPDQTIAYLGHGGKTTIKEEKLENPFLSG